jgi:uncharacterized protein YkwD
VRATKNWSGEMLRAFIFILAMASAAFAQTTSNPNNTAPSSQKSIQPTPKLLSAAVVSSAEDSAAESDLLAMANRIRREAGVPPLRMNPELTKAARAHARLMIQQRQLSHQFDGEPSLLKRLHETGVPLNSVGENVAYHASTEQVFDALMHSPPHRANLLDPDFNAAGFAAFWSEGRLYVVQDFVRQLPEVTPASQQK